jgi:hypothetical protein
VSAGWLTTFYLNRNSREEIQGPMGISLSMSMRFWEIRCGRV